MSSIEALKFLIGVIIFLGVGCHGQSESEKFELFINETLKECQAKENASDRDVELMFVDDDEWPTTYEGKCLFECFFEQMGIFRNHKFYKRGFLAIALMIEEIDEEDSDEFQQFNNFVGIINDECGSIKNPDRCENALLVAKCIDRILFSHNDQINDVLEDIFVIDRKIDTAM